MKNLLPILALLLMVGCTSELDRCLEANYAELTNKEDQEEFVASKLKSEKASFLQDFRDDPEQIRLSDQDMKWHQQRAENEELFDNMDSFFQEYEEFFPDFEMEENEEILEEQKEYEEVMGRLEKELTDLEEKHKGEYRQTVAEEYYGPEESKKREKIAEKICNAQGIY